MPHDLLVPSVHHVVLSSQALSCMPAHDLLSFYAKPEVEASVYAGVAHGRTSDCGKARCGKLNMNTTAGLLYGVNGCNL